MVVCAGTDRYPFDRLVGWAERWAERVPDWEIEIQHGFGRPPVHGRAVVRHDHDRLVEVLGEADLVVCDGGPMLVALARRHGHRPIVVPRDPARGEHEDSRQQVFARRLARAGVAELAETEDAFLAAAVASAFLPRSRPALDGARDGEVPPGVFRVGAVVEELVARRRPDRSPRPNGV
jgi:UDP-N-acetylglucosamine transferase subunit ALG13